ncbi:predicted protein [Chaetoceros tenuissimus]|uniref:Uncharacterized protein n=1 Tax=Chaetoceros tenuissimus TaxID=426638 RepID=A0AAD3H4U0_9STRA|nr:predicted protein [Chaetoceros tenuissimus]
MARPKKNSSTNQSTSSPSSSASPSKKHPSPIKSHRRIVKKVCPPNQTKRTTHLGYFAIDNKNDTKVFFGIPLKGNALPNHVVPFMKPVSDDFEGFLERESNPAQLHLISMKNFLASNNRDKIWYSDDPVYKTKFIGLVGTIDENVPDERSFAEKVAKDFVDVMNEAYRNNGNQFPSNPWVLLPLSIPEGLCLNDICYFDSNIWNILELLFDFENNLNNWYLILEDTDTLQMIYGSNTPLEQAKNMLITLKTQYSTFVLPGEGDQGP